MLAIPVCKWHISHTSSLLFTHSHTFPHPSHMQMVAMTSDLRSHDANIAGLTQQLSDALRVNGELRNQVAMLSDETHRAAADRAAATAFMERLSRQYADGTAAVMEEVSGR